MFSRWFVALLLFIVTPAAQAASSGGLQIASWVGPLILTVFTVAYLLVMLEERIKMRKSKPVLVAAGLIWALIGWQYVQQGQGELVRLAYKHTLLEFSELMLFLLVAMTYINALEERRVFEALRAWLVGKGFSLHSLFWLTGFLAFFISPIADNLTTALLMCAVVMKVAKDNRHFINLACINIVVAANAGGAFSPFGDITTLMVWQEGKVDFLGFLALFIPSLFNFCIPALLMSFAIPKDAQHNADLETVELKRGARRIGGLFLLTIATAVAFHAQLHLPPVLGMMMGLGYLQFFGYYLRMSLPRSLAHKRELALAAGDQERLKRLGNVVPFDVFNRVAHAEWDTLLFFYGVIMCVGGLGFLGYLEMLSTQLYTEWSVTGANIMMGILSAIVDNIPVMFAVLTMDPDMSIGQWLLITLTTGVGGSLLSIGSAAGVALMGQARGYYTFFGHLRWMPAIAVGYAVSIVLHLWINEALF